MKSISKNGLRNIRATSIDFGNNEGKRDSLERYFYDIGLIDQLDNNKKTLIIGRKGTGKTALATHFTDLAQRSPVKFSSVLSFRKIPIALLESLENKDFKTSGRYVALWKLIVLVELAKLVIQNESLDPDIYNRLKSLVGCISPSLHSDPSSYLKSVTKGTFKVDAKIIGGESEKSTGNEQVDLAVYIDSLQQLLISGVNYSDTYSVILDELDDSYDTDKESPNYFDLITALFKTASDLNSEFWQDRRHLNVFVALRDDIYDLIDFSDKNKWDDSAIRLNWMPSETQKAHETDLYRMINLRIGASYEEPSKPDVNYWDLAFEHGFVTGRLSSFKYILSRSLYRPRDIIEYCKQVKEAAKYDKPEKFSKKHVIKAEIGYSAWLQRELIDELKARLPERRQIFKAFERLGKVSFGIDEINREFVKIKELQNKSVKDILSILFEFSVIGMFDLDDEPPVFRYRNPYRKFETGKKYSIHYGLRAALRLGGSRAVNRSFSKSTPSRKPPNRG